MSNGRRDIRGGHRKSQHEQMAAYLLDRLSGDMRTREAATASTKIYRRGGRYHVRTIVNWYVAWACGRANRSLLSVVTITVLGGGIPLLAATAFSSPPQETSLYETVYYTALLNGRDPAAALRKAHYRTQLLMSELGMTRSEATALAVQSVIWGANNLCGG